MRKAGKIFIQALPILLMIALIPYVENDYLLTAIYAGIILVALFLKRTHHDILIFCVGFVGMIVSEYFFVLSGYHSSGGTVLWSLGDQSPF